MLSPAQAIELMRELGVRGLDDPAEAGLSYRWWLTEGNYLQGAHWRGPVKDYGPIGLLRDSTEPAWRATPASDGRASVVPNAPTKEPTT